METAKRLIRSALKTIGYDIVRLNKSATNGPTINFLPILIEHCLAVQGIGTIIQIGANDGQLDDPVHQILKDFSLPAVLVEPLPDKFDQLRRNYAGYRLIRFENVAIGSEDGEAELFRINPRAQHLPEWVHGIASFRKETLLKHRNWGGVKGHSFEAHIETASVKMMTFARLIEKHADLPKPIMLQVDTEGYDFMIIKFAVEAGCLPPIIHYEHWHLTFAEQVDCRELLSANGYAFSSGVADTLAFRAGRLFGN